MEARIFTDLYGDISVKIRVKSGFYARSNLRKTLQERLLPHLQLHIGAGAALGFIAGRTAIWGTKRELAGRKPLSGFLIMPVYGYGQRGISVRLSY